MALPLPTLRAPSCPLRTDMAARFRSPAEGITQNSRSAAVNRTLRSVAKVFCLLDTCQVAKAAAEQAAGRPYVIRPPLAARAYIVVFMCIWCGFVLAGLIAAIVNASPAVVILLLMLSFGLTFGYRLFRLSVTLYPQGLLVRNIYRTRHVARADIEGFRQGAESMQPFTRTIYVMLRDGSVLPLDVAGRRFVFGRGRALLDERMRTLQNWLDQGCY